MRLPEQPQDGRADPGFEDLTPPGRALAAQWLEAAGAPGVEEPQNIGLAPLRQMLGKLIDGRSSRLTRAVREQTVRRLEHVVVAMLRELTAYTTWTGRRQAVRERVAAVLRREAPAVVVAHSLGSFVTYETLRAPGPARRAAAHGRLAAAAAGGAAPAGARTARGPGARPAGVKRWVNLADVGDLVL